MSEVGPLVRGLELGSRPWCPYVASFMCEYAAVWTTGPRTMAAEAALEITPSVYWYIRRVHHAFNGVVMFHRVKRDVLQPTERGACPFDTGALWSGNTIKTSMTDDEKRAYFAAHDRPISLGLDAFEPWIRENYAGVRASYDEGAPPSREIRRICEAVDADAAWAPWTWEVRVEKARVKRLMQPIGVVWTRDREEEFKEWIDEHSGLDALAARDLQQLVAEIELHCDATETAYQRACRYIREGS